LACLRGGPDGELEALDETIAELAGPHHVLGTHHGHNGASQGHEIGIAAYFDGLGGADLDAGKTFPALIRLLIVSLHGVWVQDHQVVGANVHASGLVAALAAVTFFLNYKTWHLIYLLSLSRIFGGIKAQKRQSLTFNQAIAYISLNLPVGVQYIVEISDKPLQPSTWLESVIRFNWCGQADKNCS
jgi:hypothetical protein